MYRRRKIDLMLENNEIIEMWKITFQRERDNKEERKFNTVLKGKFQDKEIRNKKMYDKKCTKKRKWKGEMDQQKRKSSDEFREYLNWKL